MQSVTTDTLLAASADAAGAVAGAAIASLLFAFVQLVIAAGLYVWTAMALAAVFRKADRPASRAWVPVWNLWTLFELAGMKGWWSLVLVGGGLLTTVLASVTSALFLSAAQDAAFAGGDAAGALLAATVIPTLLLLVFAAAATFLLVRMMGPLSRGFERGTGFVVLGVLLLPVWASLIGWGPARWHPVPRGGLPPTPFAQDPAPSAPAPAADTTTFAPPPAAPSSPVASPAAPVAPWSPPSLAGPLAPAHAPAATPAPGVEEHTIVAAHRRAAALRLPDGRTLPLSADQVVLGRNPTPPADAPGAQTIAIDDATRTVSKTHALLRRGDDGGWTVTDLSSTNGVLVGGTEAPVGVAVAVTGRFLLGDAELDLDPGAR